MKIKQLNIISVQEWDNLVQKTYGRTYSFQQQDDCKGRGLEYITVPVEHPEDYKNDSIPEVINGEDMGVSFKAWLERDPAAPLKCTEREAKNCNYYWGNSEEDLEKWQKDSSHITLFYERNFYPHVDMIINDLHSKGLLEAGKYAIEIAW